MNKRPELYIELYTLYCLPASGKTAYANNCFRNC